jgi:xanthine dehydrogenase molybdopterin-binding subunit B
MTGSRRARGKPSTPSLRSVGRKVPRKEGVAKVTGASRYIDDISFPGMLYGATVRSTIARGEILSVTYGFDAAGFTVVDSRDIPGKNVIALIEEDQPCLAEREVRHPA